MEDVKPPVSAESSGLNETGGDMSNVSNTSIIKRVQLPEDEKVERTQFLELWQEQNRYIDHLEAKLKVCKFFSILNDYPA